MGLSFLPAQFCHSLAIFNFSGKERPNKLYHLPVGVAMVVVAVGGGGGVKWGGGTTSFTDGQENLGTSRDLSMEEKS